MVAQSTSSYAAIALPAAILSGVLLSSGTIRDLITSLGARLIAYAPLAALAAALLGLVLRYGGIVSLDPPPWPVFRFGVWAMQTMDAFRDVLPPPHVRAVEISFLSAVRPQLLHALAALDVPEALHGAPKTAAELAPLVGVPDATKLERLLRAATAMRLLSVSGRATAGVARYRNTAISETLREADPRSVRAIVLNNMEDCMPAYRQLVNGLRQDKVPFELHTGGVDFWEHMRCNPALEARFSAAMTAGDIAGTPAIAADFAWAEFERVIDVAGAHGAVLAAILRANPSVRGVLFDMPQIIERAQPVRATEEWREKRRDLLQRIEFAGGDFFDAATLPTADPTSRDVFMLRCVLHDWNDDKTRAILRSLRTAMGASKRAKLALVEVIPHSDLAHEDLPARQALDVQMLVVVDGKERSREDWEPLLRETGFKLQSIQSTRGIFRILLADPV